MNHKAIIQQVFLIVMGVGAIILVSNCTTSGGGAPGGGQLPPATKETPFVNSLGMKFVPVPGTNILMCTTETTVGQYKVAGLGYQEPDFVQGSDHPAVNISWNDAQRWCRWLSKKEGRKYRVPNSPEWFAATGPLTYPWGNSWPPPNFCGNYIGQEHKGSQVSEAYFRKKTWKAGELGLISNFRDRHLFTAPVGSYPVNGLGLYDLGGNAEEWCTMDGRGCLRGGTWGDPFMFALHTDLRTGKLRRTMESTFRTANWPSSGGSKPTNKSPEWGFRVVLEK